MSRGRRLKKPEAHVIEPNVPFPRQDFGRDWDSVLAKMRHGDSVVIYTKRLCELIYCARMMKIELEFKNVGKTRFRVWKVDEVERVRSFYDRIKEPAE